MWYGSAHIFEMQKVWLTSDSHYFHKLLVSERGFSSVEEMNGVLVENWNALVEKNDIVYHLGDLSLASHKQTIPLVSSLNGRIRWIRGNHDSRKESKKVVEGCKNIEWFKDTEGEEFDVNGEKIYIWMSHFAHRVWNKRHYGSLHAYGHSHGSLGYKKNSLDVGVDSWGFKPISLEFFVEMINNMNSKNAHVETLDKMSNLWYDTKYIRPWNRRIAMKRRID